jgi:NADH:ubiquinone reductase (non-electrogenic)
MKGSDGSIFALGDCSATSYAPTAQVASQQGAYLGKLFGQMAEKDKLTSERVATLNNPEPDEEAKARLVSIDKRLNKLENLRPFHYSHQGSLAYVLLTCDSIEA